MGWKTFILTKVCTVCCRVQRLNSIGPSSPLFADVQAHLDALNAALASAEPRARAVEVLGRYSLATVSPIVFETLLPDRRARSSTVANALLCMKRIRDADKELMSVASLLSPVNDGALGASTSFTELKGVCCACCALSGRHWLYHSLCAVGAEAGNVGQLEVGCE